MRVKIVFIFSDMRKSVVDIIYYRNKIGIEETSEVFKNYINAGTDK